MRGLPDRSTRPAGLILILSLLLTVPLLSQTLPAWNINLVSETNVSGDYVDVVVVDTVAYYSNQWGLVLFDVSNPAEAELIKRIPTPGISERLFNRDSLLFVCDSHDGLRIYDISDLINPQQIGYCPEAFGAKRIDINGDFAYLVGNGDIYIVQIENPRQPTLHSVYSDDSRIIELVCIGNYVYYISDNQQILKVLDVSDSHNPRYAGDFQIIEQGHFLHQLGHCDGNILLTSGFGFHVLSVENPESPEQIGFLEDIYGYDPTVYLNMVFLGTRRLSCIDISDPANPTLLQSLERPYISTISAEGKGLFADRGKLYVADGNGQVRIYDVSDPQNMTEIYEFLDFYNVMNVAINDDYAYIDDASGFRDEFGPYRYWLIDTYQINQPENPVYQSSLSDVYYNYYCFKIVNDYLYISRQQICGFEVISLADPANPRHVNTVNNLNYSHLRDIIEYEGFLYAVTWHHGVAIFTIRGNPAEPQLIQEVQYIPNGYQEGRSYDTAIDNGFLYYSSGFGIVIYSLEDPPDPEFISATDFELIPYHIAVQDGFLYGSCTDGLLIFSVEDPEHPEFIEVRPDKAGSYSNLYIENDVLYVSDQIDGIWMYSLDDPSNPELIGYRETPYNALRLQVVDNYIYVADVYDFCILDASHAQGAWFLDVNQEAYNFGSVESDSTQDWELIISNNSSAEREIASITADDQHFTCPFDEAFVLAEDQDTTFTVSFTPDEPGDYSSLLTIESDNRSLNIHLTGVGLPLDVEGSDPAEIPLSFGFSRIYPNPFNSSVTISYDVNRPLTARISIFDLTGREVTVLADAVREPGRYRAVWNAEMEAAGVYFVRLTNGDQVFNRKLILVK